jgi:hypothetical protein
MSTGDQSFVRTRARGRSAISNGRRLLDGVDHRSAQARRFRDLVNAFAANFGGVAALTEGERVLVRQAAACALRAEQLQAALVKGDPVEPDELIRLANTSRRMLASIAARERTVTELDGLAHLRSYLAQVST